jgi:uncharacterized membrane protein YphA (DoxX/SURF4 family)
MTSASIKPIVDVYHANVQPRLNRLWKHPQVARASAFATTHFHSLARTLVCLYFVNLAVTNFNYWWLYNLPGIPWAAFPMLPCAVAVLFNRKVHWSGSVLFLLALNDAAHITYNQLYVWLVDGHELYINELMVKKAAMMGSVLMIVVNDPYFKTTIDHTSKALSGLIVSDQPKFKLTTRISLALLLVRVLISSLFLFVGYGEIKRQWVMTHDTDHNHYHRPEGDGHNNMWPKLFEFTLTLPFVIGFKTSWVALGIAVCLVLEALIYWNFWSTVLGLGYAIHARDHFCVNIGVAGGLLLLQSFGGGQYSVDELMKKKD